VAHEVAKPAGPSTELSREQPAQADEGDIGQLQARGVGRMLGGGPVAALEAMDGVRRVREVEAGGERGCRRVR
jgi:hypothetical protein